MDEAQKEAARERAKDRLFENILRLEDEVTQLRAALAASQAREARLRESLKNITFADEVRVLLRDTPTDDAALREMIEAERDRIIRLLAGIDRQQSDDDEGWWETSAGAEFGAGIIDAIRARKG